MWRKRDGWVPIPEDFSDLGGPVKALRKAVARTLLAGCTKGG